MFNFIQEYQARKARAQSCYDAAEAQARLPVFYEQYGVPDTPYGRFDMIALHCYLLVRRLNNAGEEKVAQKVFDIMFRTLDMAMREMGIGDLSVPKKMKRFMHAFNGRSRRYEAALTEGNDEALHEIIRKNIYGTAESVGVGHIQKVADYIKTNADLKMTGDGFVMPEGIEEEAS